MWSRPAAHNDNLVLVRQRSIQSRPEGTIISSPGGGAMR